MNSDNMNRGNTETGASIYRYQFTEQINEAITNFSKIHMYDHRQDYKEAWIAWWEINKTMLEDEATRLQVLGYKGDVQDKMYKAGRYYFRKKEITKQKPKERQTYVIMDKAVIQAMDTHISKYMNQIDFTPADGYVDFCQNNITIINDEINRLSREGGLNPKDFVGKFKKTYKNRYYIMSRQKNQDHDDDNGDDEGNCESNGESNGEGQ